MKQQAERCHGTATTHTRFKKETQNPGSDNFGLSFTNQKNETWYLVPNVASGIIGPSRSRQYPFVESDPGARICAGKDQEENEATSSKNKTCTVV